MPFCVPFRSTPLMRVMAEKGIKVAAGSTSSVKPYFSRARATIERPSGVSSERLESMAASARSRSSTPCSGTKRVAWRLPSVMVPVLSKQQHVDVARRLDRAPAHGQHVALHHAVHARDADGRQEAADGGGNQAHQQRDQRRHRDRLAGVDGERLQRDHDQQEDDGQGGDQDVQRDLVGGLLAFGSLHQGDHAVQEGFAGIGADLHHDPVGENARAAGHGAAVAAALADDGGRLAGDGRLVHRGHALHHVAVAGDDLPGLDQHQVALAQLGRGDFLHRAVPVGAREPLRHGGGARAAQGIGLGLAASLGHGLGEVGEDHREPQPDGHRQHEEDLEVEVRAIERRRGLGEQEAHELDGGDDTAHLHHEHDRVLDLHARVQFLEGVGDGAPDDLGIPDREMLPCGASSTA